MNVLTTILYTLVIVVAVLLTILILIQPSKSGGFGAVFGGVGESVFGARAGSHLTKATVVLAVIFFVLALTLAAIIGHKSNSRSLVAQYAEEAQAAETVPAEVPEVPEAPAMAPAEAEVPATAPAAAN